MKPHKLNNKGFSAVEAIVAIVAIGALVGASFYALKAHNGAKTTSQVVKAPIVATDLYVGWKTYTSHVDGASFRYPSDWKITDQSYAGRDFVSIVSPKGSYLVYDSNVNGQGDGTCNPNGSLDSFPACVDVAVTSLEAVPSNKTLFVAVTDGKYPLLCILSTTGEPPAKLGNTGIYGTSFHPNFKSKDGLRNMEFFTNRIGDAPQHFEPADEASIKLMLKSLTF